MIHHVKANTKSSYHLKANLKINESGLSLLDGVKRIGFTFPSEMITIPAKLSERQFSRY